MQKLSAKFELPFFVGFYESVYYNSDTLYWETHDGDNMEELRERFNDPDLEEDDVDIDFKRYQEDICEAFVDAFDNNAPDFIDSIIFDEMTSPKYYNFETDKIWCDVYLSPDWLKKVNKFMTDNKDWVENRIKEDCTSYDGFFSYLDNTYDGWVKELNSEDPDDRYIGIMIGYMMYFENDRIREDLEEETLEDIYIWDYLISTKEKTMTIQE